MDNISILIFLLFLFDTVLCGEYCYDTWSTFYCSYGCCGVYGDEYCCGVYSWIIGVAVVGCIIFFAVVIFIIIFVKKKNMRLGRVFSSTQPQTVHTTQVVHIPPSQPNPPPYQSQQYGQQYGQQQTQMYNNHPQGVYPPPPAINYGQDPAYPPQ